MTTQPPIPASEVPELYRRNNMKPTKGIFYCSLGSPDACGCLIGVLAVDKLGANSVPDAYISFADLGLTIGLSYEFVDGATNGFDGDVASNMDDPNHPESIAGYQWGVESWQECCKAGLVENAK